LNVDLSYIESGAGSGPTVIILHGLFGMARNWATIARALATTHRVVSVDLRNHGNSPWHDEMTYPAMAGDVARLIKTQAVAQQVSSATAWVARPP
jgi:pimeloyl-ACP methyl ester carboxylesterase